MKKLLEVISTTILVMGIFSIISCSVGLDGHFSPKANAMRRPPTLYDLGPSNSFEHQILLTGKVAYFLRKYALAFVDFVLRSDYEACWRLYRQLHNLRIDLEQQFIPDLVSLDYQVNERRKRTIIYNIREMTPDNVSSDVEVFANDKYLFFLRSGDVVLSSGTTALVMKRKFAFRIFPEAEYFPAYDFMSVDTSKNVADEDAARLLLRELRIFASTMEFCQNKADYSWRVNNILEETFALSDFSYIRSLVSFKFSTIVLPETLEEFRNILSLVDEQEDKERTK